MVRMTMFAHMLQNDCSGDVHICMYNKVGACGSHLKLGT